ncbi:methyl-accepting chemotaxis protein [Roseomonas marmotae]|uniref:HAMP domain-containing protein n=1 Tax=Roseomonas marmotae TaxID=2768161 RepID=A0ABS3K7Z4_9PROT|nr:methyl-accepting chemotaxis protein [Roseomonas marmotae]MBO1073588.1 HAMP domain-containing protein [Roseomonas marmotae]QTI80231.1 HAMP domain-containing protein [Roseomonas marmotae]
MRVFLNLRVGMKLALSAVLALLLLAGQGLRTQERLGEVMRLDERLQATIQADSVLREALSTALRAELLSLAAATAQTAETSAQAAAAASIKLESVQRLLRQAAERLPLPEARMAVQEVAPLATRYGAALAEAMTGRQRLLDLRDTRFFAALANFDQRFEAALGNLAYEVEGGEQQDMMRERLLAYQAAANDMRMSIQRFLATGDPDQARRAKRAMAQMQVHGRGARGIPASAPYGQDLDRLLAQSADLAATVQEMIAATEAAAALQAERVAPARQALEAAMQHASGLMGEGVVQGMATAASTLDDLQDETLLVAVLIVAMLLLSAWATARAVGAPLRRLVVVLQRIAGGDTAVEVGDRARRDEIGAIAGAVEELRTRVGEAFAQRQMIEQMPVGVMRADPGRDFRIDFMNAEMRRILESVPQILPCSPQEALGQSIDIFHRDPAHQRALLADGSRLPYQARIRVGGEVMDLTVSAIRDGAGAYLGPMLVWRMVTEQARLADTFEAEMGSAVSGLADRAAELQQSARQLAGAAVTSGREAAMVADAAGRADADVQAVAAAAEQMAASVAEITRRVSESAEVAGRAVQEAQATDGTMRGLSEAAARIGDVVRLIGDIAGQTNLLALNATIEAARAGEAGKGFAVVASEVKNLAGQTARATEEIAGQIAGMQASTERAVEAIRGIGATVERTSEIATAIAAAVEQQGSATQEIARSAAQVAEATGTVTQRIGVVRQVAAETGEAAGGMLGAVEELAGQAGMLRQRSGSFLSAIRS